MAFENDLVEGRSSNFSECSSNSSVSEDGDFTRMNSGSVISRISRSRKLKRMMKKLVKDSKKSLYGSSKPPSVFSYDAVSYSLNFDDGHHSDEFDLYR
ncbi:hypothetical protein SSX86_014275 [Deinandra increscens subsp. villosa]|uniref:Uncharacterized protein n=1 Tax=Deinandra increscens subsp. villosa TaxID=3103831 RepID=A0AAP0D387_9ASTR